MKQLIVILLLGLLPLGISAQSEPKNNLRKTLPQLEQKFPDIIPWGMYGNYKSPSSNILFGIKDGIVISEFTLFEGEPGYLSMLFDSLVNSYSKSTKHALWADDKKSVIFIYSYFSVRIGLNSDCVTLSYDINPNS